MDDDILRRLRRLEDREKICELQATYCFLVDDRRFDELVDHWFAEDARCDFRDVTGAMQPMISTGRAEIRAFFKDVVGRLLDDMCHTVHNQRIVVDGDTATGDCYFELTAIDLPNRESVVGAGRYLDTYRRVDGAWRFAQRDARIFYLTALAGGWSRQRLLPVLAGF